jgi:uncharacterized Zn-binding protein involved in type VI secretion
MPNDSRITDVGVGVCCCHCPICCIGMSGNLITGASTVLYEGQPSSRISDTVLGGCGHTGTMVGGSSTVIIEGMGTSRIGDSFVGCFSGSLVTGASTIISGG